MFSLSFLHYVFEVRIAILEIDYGLSSLQVCVENMLAKICYGVLPLHRGRPRKDANTQERKSSWLKYYEKLTALPPHYNVQAHNTSDQGHFNVVFSPHHLVCTTHDTILISLIY
jgi:hypothetical protein